MTKAVHIKKTMWFFRIYTISSYAAIADCKGSLQYVRGKKQKMDITSPPPPPILGDILVKYAFEHVLTTGKKVLPVFFIG